MDHYNQNRHRYTFLYRHILVVESLVFFRTLYYLSSFSKSFLLLFLSFAYYFGWSYQDDTLNLLFIKVDKVCLTIFMASYGIDIKLSYHTMRQNLVGSN